MIKIYDLLFEQDNTNTTTSTQPNPEDFKQAITTAVETAVKKPLESIKAWMKQHTGTNQETPTNSESTYSTTATKPTKPSKPAGMKPKPETASPDSDS